jgi:hypothetical protein
VALFEFLLAAARAWIVAANVFQGVAYRFLMAVIAIWAMYVTMIVVVSMAVLMVAVRAVYVFLLGHASYSGM